MLIYTASACARRASPQEKAEAQKPSIKAVNTCVLPGADSPDKTVTVPQLAGPSIL